MRPIYLFGLLLDRLLYPLVGSGLLADQLSLVLKDLELLIIDIEYNFFRLFRSFSLLLSSSLYSKLVSFLRSTYLVQ